MSQIQVHMFGQQDFAYQAARGQQHTGVGEQSDDKSRTDAVPGAAGGSETGAGAAAGKSDEKSFPAAAAAGGTPGAAQQTAAEEETADVTQTAAAAVTGSAQGASSAAGSAQAASESTQSAAAQSSAAAGTTVPNTLDADVVEISGASEEYDERLDEAKTRREKLHEALRKYLLGEDDAENPFKFTDDDNKQHSVFVQHLEDQGFFKGMSKEERGKTEGLLKNITSAMDQISPNSKLANSALSPSAVAAQVAFSASVQALRQFVDSQLSGDLARSFNSVVDAYASHNEPIAASHRNATDIKDRALAQSSRLSSYARTAGHTSRAARTASISARLGRVETSKAQKQDVRDAASSYFQQVRSGTITVDAAISKLQGSFLQHASGGSQDGEVRSVLIQRNSALFQQIHSYWGVLMRSL